MKVLRIYLNDSVVRLQDSNLVGGSAGSHSVDVNAALVKSVGNRKAVIVVNLILVERHVDRLQLPVAVIAAASTARVGNRVGLHQVRAPLNLRVKRLRLRQLVHDGDRRVCHLIRPRKSQLDDVILHLQQLGGARKRNPDDALVVDGQQRVAHLNVPRAERDPAVLQPADTIGFCPSSLPAKVIPNGPPFGWSGTLNTFGCCAKNDDVIKLLF